MKRSFPSKPKTLLLAVYSLFTAFLIVCCIFPLATSSEGEVTIGKSVSLLDDNRITCTQSPYTLEDGSVGTIYVFRGLDSFKVRRFYIQLEEIDKSGLRYFIYSENGNHGFSADYSSTSVITPNERKDLLKAQLDPCDSLRLDFPRTTVIKKIVISEGVIIPNVTVNGKTAFITAFLACGLFAVFLLLYRALSSSQNRKNGYVYFKIIAAFGYLCLLLFWVLSQGFNRAPDELMRFNIPEFIFQKGRLPTVYDTELLDPQWGTSYAMNPNLPFLYQALFLKLFSLFGVTASGLYLAARTANALLGAAFLWLCTDIAAKLTQNKYSVYTFVAVIALWPQAMFMFTYSNPDAMMLAGCALTVLSWINGIRSFWDLRSCVMLSLGMVIVVLSYSIGYPYILASIIVFAGTFLFRRKSENRLKPMITKGLGISALSLIGSGWFFIRNFRLYGVLYGGGKIAQEMRDKYCDPAFSRENMLKTAREMLDTPQEIVQWFWWSDLSFIGVFGYVDKGFGQKFYTVVNVTAAVLLILALCGIVVNKAFKTTERKLLAVSFLIAGLIGLMISFYYSYTADYEPQGRYLFASLIPLALLLTYGIRTLGKALKIKSKYLSLFFSVLLLAIDLYAIVFLIPV